MVMCFLLSLFFDLEVRRTVGGFVTSLQSLRFEGMIVWFVVSGVRVFVCWVV